MNKFWSSNVQEYDCHQQYFIVYLKFAKKVDLSSKNTERKKGGREEGREGEGERERKGGEREEGRKKRKENRKGKERKEEKKGKGRKW